MENKTFLLELSKDKIDMLDVYCVSKNISRTEFFRQLFNAWLVSNASEIGEVTEEIKQKGYKLMTEDFKGSLEKTSQMMRTLMPIPNYLDLYRDTEMYEAMISNKKVVERPDELLSQQVMSFEEREQLKKFADKMADYCFFDEAVMLKDISHWQRYLEKNPGKEKTFLEYVDRKYTNPDLKSY